MAQPAQMVYTTTGSETAQPMMTYQPMDAAQPITYASEPGPSLGVDPVSAFGEVAVRERRPTLAAAMLDPCPV
ncbi:hypothetical protein AK812_SmicGene37859 [Symbiodinium microadriaticum]|uniref:Uncharacterized protein n=1 Tax=Symbiodinium microadriaticum TaxID=2951 RepID=A0A1Q9CFA5_SYMMI|nr:hypothetical protein AK812_SmicGene37859 [Symbiodinium microadriaticum]